LCLNRLHILSKRLIRRIYRDQQVSGQYWCMIIYGAFGKMMT